jgi:uncharacterized protein (DUF3084 family)
MSEPATNPAAFEAVLTLLSVATDPAATKERVEALRLETKRLSDERKRLAGERKAAEEKLAALDASAAVLDARERDIKAREDMADLEQREASWRAANAIHADRSEAQRRDAVRDAAASINRDLREDPHFPPLREDPIFKGYAS